MRRPLAPPNQRHVAEREPSRLLQPPERDVLNERKDAALEGGEIDELAVLRPTVASRRWPAGSMCRSGGVNLATFGSIRLRSLWVAEPSWSASPPAVMAPLSLRDVASRHRGEPFMDAVRALKSASLRSYRPGASCRRAVAS
jgi:hypothetical protein